MLRRKHTFALCNAVCDDEVVCGSGVSSFSTAGPFLHSPPMAESSGRSLTAAPFFYPGGMLQCNYPQ
jgi:hypothetical protein